MANLETAEELYELIELREFGTGEYEVPRPVRRKTASELRWDEERAERHRQRKEAHGRLRPIIEGAELPLRLTMLKFASRFKGKMANDDVDYAFEVYCTFDHGDYEYDGERDRWRKID